MRQRMLERPPLPPEAPTTPPSASCYACGGIEWRTVPGGMTCARCHPAPGAVASTQPRDALRTKLLAWARTHDYPRLPLSDILAVGAGEHGWEAFTTHGPDALVARAWAIAQVAAIRAA